MVGWYMPPDHFRLSVEDTTFLEARTPALLQRFCGTLKSGNHLLRLFAVYPGAKGARCAPHREKPTRERAGRTLGSYFLSPHNEKAVTSFHRRELHVVTRCSIPVFRGIAGDR